MNDTSLRVALCGIGLDAYWPQFVGLRDRLEGCVRIVADKVSGFGAVVENLGLIDSPQRGREAGRICRTADVDLLIIYVTTYALSTTVLPLVQRAQVPVLVLNLQPADAIDYESFNRLPDRTAMTAEWLAFCSACPVPEIANVFRRAGIPFHQITGVLGDESVEAEIGEWIDAARVRQVLQNNRLGLMGHYYSGMLDIQTDLTQVAITFGTHIEHIEVDQLSAICKAVNDAEISQRISQFHSHFEVQPDCSAEELARAARTSVALDRFVAEHDLQSLAYYYKGTGIPANEDTMSSIIVGTSLLTARGIPVAGEYEVKNALAMKIMGSFGAGGSFTEYYALDLKADHVLMGHDGPGHIAIAEGGIKVRPLSVYHGKVGKGLGVEMSVKHGPVTLLSIVEDPARGFKLLAAHGESVPGEILRIGNTNSHYRFPLGARGFVEAWNAHGPAHHCAVGVGHIAGKLNKLASLLQIPFVQVC
ncbi:L-arabinose isomerase family protein [Occallatibacter riparius]|uniref:Arabinose isomerase n=1 Tax=Occallatibacter riparius TaxID=1002689 RepID=A0A9J7BPQ5_9BACT|nr:arabinose isomerase [Occallatibacter riparius]UWZ84583.1 arabinose isomerase [Occallatibacter riparius]